MRPLAIIAFERLFLGTLVVGLIREYFDWDMIVDMTAAADVTHPVALILGVQLLITVIIVGLVLLISRRRSKIAMWLIILLTIGGFYSFVPSLQEASTVSGIFGIVQAIGQLAGLALLFTPTARQWMAQKTAEA